MRTWRKAMIPTLLVGAMAGSAEELSIRSFDVDGTITFNAVSNATLYQVDESVDGVWADAFSFPATANQTVTAAVSMAEQSTLFCVSATVSDPAPTGFALIPSGTFTMGSPTHEPGRDVNETLHPVTLTRDVFMQKTEVTNRQMADMLNWVLSRGKITADSATVRNKEGDRRELLDLDSSYCQIFWNGSQLMVDPGRDTYPCVEVSWYGAQAYCNYLSDMEGLNRAIGFGTWTVHFAANGYRLPTESEWEYACRAGTTTAYYTGAITYTGSDPVDPNLDAAGWYWGNATNPEYPMQSGKGTHPVGAKQPNDWDLFDMHGNTWEWCGDWLGDYSETGTDPIGPSSGTDRVCRGGAWLGDAQACRSAARLGTEPDIAGSNRGFRPVRNAAAP